jgi:segregation and condensation protein B
VSVSVNAPADEDHARLLRMVEALLFASEAPLSPHDIAAALGEPAPVSELLALLARHYAGRGINLVERGGRWHMQTAPDLAHLLRPVHERRRKLSRAALETLAIIAYEQPVTRARIEEVRGVSISAGTIEALIEAGWVRLAGRKDTPGRPLQYATTQGFLAHFGLSRREDLPRLAELDPALGG